MANFNMNELKKEWELFWGEAPPGSLKHKKGKEILRFIQTAISKAEDLGINKTVDFMKGKVIDMPVGSGIPLVVKESFVRKAVKLLTQKK